MQEFIEGTAVNVGVRLGCKGIVIRCAWQLSSLQYQSTKITNVLL